MVPAGSQTEASIVIEEMNYSGGYTLTSTLSGVVTVSIRRSKDGKFILLRYLIDVFRHSGSSRHRPRRYNLPGFKTATKEAGRRPDSEQSSAPDLQRLVSLPGS